MKRYFALFLLCLVCESVWASGFSVIQQFPTRVSNPLSTVVHDGYVYGIADIQESVTPVEISIFRFDLSGQNFEYQDLDDSVRSLGTLAPGAGPLVVADGRFWGTYDFDGSVFAAELSDLTSAARIHFSDLAGNQPNPVSVGDTLFVGAAIGQDSGVRTLSSSGVPGREIVLESRIDGSFGTTTALATDGTRVYAATAPRAVDGGIYSFLPDGSEQTFIGSVNENVFGLAVQDQTLFGIGDQGVFKSNLDGSDFQILRDIAGERLIVVGDKIYGSNNDSLFQIDTDGTDYEVLHAFGAGPDNGTNANSDLQLVGSKLYGSTYRGGANGVGIFYSYDLGAPQAVPEASSITVWLVLLCGVVIFVRRQRR